MTAMEPRTLDVREILKAGGEPFGEIMAAVAALQPGQGLKLLATFKPVPLFGVLGQRGFSHAEREIGGGDWEVLFTPAGMTVPSTAAKPSPANGAAPAAAPARHLDNRGLQPPEPMVRILETLETMAPGEVLEVINDREPTLLYPELAARGHVADTQPREGGGFRLLIQCKGKKVPA